MKAVKHDEAAKKAQKEKKPIGIGAKTFNYKNVPKVTLEEGVEKNNRNLATLNMLNGVTHNSYVEIPISQRMALYFDSKAVDSVSSGSGTLMAGILGGMGLGGIMGGMFGGPLGFLFGAALGRLLGNKLLSPIKNVVSRLLGAIIGTGTGFVGNALGKNSLSDSQVRQLPGFMSLLPKDKLELYVKTLFHTGYFGKQHARLPYHYLHTEPQDNLSAILGRSEMSFTFTLTDRMVLNHYSQDTGKVTSSYEGTTADIGQDKGDGIIALIDEKARLLKGQLSYSKNEEDKRVDFQGYGYIIEGFNVKCVGKVPFTITFYSPAGYLYGDEEGDLKEGDKEFKHPGNRPAYQVGRGTYGSQAIYSKDSRLGQNTKNLAKPHRAVLPFRYPRACLPVPPVDLKDPTGGGEGEVLKVKTNWVNQQVGDIFNGRTIPVPGKEPHPEKLLVAYWDIPEYGYEVTKEINLQILFNLPSFKGDMILADGKDTEISSILGIVIRNEDIQEGIDKEDLYHHLPEQINDQVNVIGKPELSPISNESDQVNLKVERALDIEFEQEVLSNKKEGGIKEGNYVDFPNYTPGYYIMPARLDGSTINGGVFYPGGGKYEGYHGGSKKPIPYTGKELIPNSIQVFGVNALERSIVCNTLFLTGKYRLQPFLTNNPPTSRTEIPYRTYLRNVFDGRTARLELWIEVLPGNTYSKDIF